MLHIRKAFCLFLTALFLVQPVFAETKAVTGSVEPDIVTAICKVQALPDGAGPLSPQTAETELLRDLTSAPLYAMADDGTWSPILAGALPQDVTADYAGAYGIPKDARRGYAFQISLNADACWEDGLSITADDYVFSIERLLNNEETAQSWTFLANAEAILSAKPQQGSNIISLRASGFRGVSEAWSAGYTEFYIDTDGFWGLDGGWKSVSDHNRLRDYAMPGGLDEYFVTPAYLYNNYLMDGMEQSRYQSEFIGICQTPGNALTMDDLGLIKINDHELILITQVSSTASMLMQRLESLYLFRENGGSNLSYGPYRITSVTDEELTLEPNPTWWGASDPRGYDRILFQKIGT